MRRAMIFLMVLFMSIVFAGTAAAAPGGGRNTDDCNNSGGNNSAPGDENGNCGVGPKPDPVVTENVVFTVDCEARLVYNTTTVTTTDYVRDGRNWVLGTPVVEVTNGERRATNIECPVGPQPEDLVSVVYGEETVSCDSGMAYRTVTETTTPYVLRDGFWLLGDPIVVVREESRPNTAEETAACPDERDPVVCVDPEIWDGINCVRLEGPEEAPIVDEIPPVTGGPSVVTSVDQPAVQQATTPQAVVTEAPAVETVETAAVVEQGKADNGPAVESNLPIPVYNGVFAQPNNYEAPLNLRTDGFEYQGNDSFIYGGLAVLACIIAGGIFYMAWVRRLTDSE